MIRVETIEISGNSFTRTYSDKNRFVVRDGISYAEAIDPADSGREYTEGEVMSDEDADEATAEDYKAALENLGVIGDA